MIDAHLHLWDPRRLTYDWLAHVPAIAAPHGDAEWRAQDIAIDGAVFVQAGDAPGEYLAEVDWVATLPLPILGIVAYAPLDDGDGAIDALTRLKTRPQVKGVRRNAQGESDGFMTTPGYLSGLVAAARLGFTIDMCVRHHQLAEMLRAMDHLFNAVPQACVVLDHLGKPDIASHGGDISGGGWRDAFDRLAPMPNLYCKLSGLPTEAQWAQWQPDQLRPYLEHAIETFGSARCLYGGDWPVVDLAGGLGRWIDVVRAATDALPAESRQNIWSETAQKVYRL